MIPKNYSKTDFDWRHLPRPFSVLAPMEDVTDTSFRRLILQCGAPDLLYTEFVSAEGFCSVGQKHLRHRLVFRREEKPLIAQIWGNRPECYRTIIQEIVALGFDGVDINMGCPVHKVVKKGYCSALIKNRSLARELILAAQEAAGDCIPVSVKTRLGYDRVETESWAGFLLELKPAAVTMHGRVATEQSHYPADWEEIAKVVALRDTMSPGTAVVGNGDVGSYQEIQDKHQTYGVDGIMVGRGIFKNPFLFRADGVTIRNQSRRQRLELLLQHATLFTEDWGKTKSYAVLKKCFKIYVAGFPGASALREKLMETHSLDEARHVLEPYLLESDE